MLMRDYVYVCVCVCVLANAGMRANNSSLSGSSTLSAKEAIAEELRGAYARLCVFVCVCVF